MNAQWISRIAMLVLSTAGFGLAAGGAHAQTYPTKPITYLVPFGPGSGNDVIARIVAQKVSENWTQPVVVENRPGASGGIAMEMTAKAPPDGYTIVIASTSHILNQFASKVRYDIIKDFTPVTVTGTLPYVMAVTASSPAKSVKELVALAKSSPGKFNYAAVIGGLPHLLGVMLESEQKVKLMMVPYKSTTDATTDVLNGRVQIWFTTMASALPQAKAGKIRILAVSEKKRAAVLPDVPTMAEVGLAKLEVLVSFFVLAPAGTPKPIVNALNSQFVKAIGTKEVSDRLAAAGVGPSSSSQEEIEALLKSEVARWSKIIEEAKISVN